MNSSVPIQHSSMSSSSSSSTAPNVQEYSIRVPKTTKKKYKIMRFNSNLNVDFTKWTQVKMERENNKVERHVAEEIPKFGAGSEYRRVEKEEARRRRLGYVSRHYNPDDQPWILKCGGKAGKKFKGIREGGVAENASYYIFTHGSDGSIEAYPVSEWYNFQPIQRFKALTAEEAEQEFGKRNRSLNYFSLMTRKRIRKDDEDELEEEGKSKKKGARDLKISEMDDWVDSDEDDIGESDENDSDEDKDTKMKKKATKKKIITEKKKKKANSDESAFEESDDGDEEGRELDYISDSSESISDDEAKIDKEMKGVSEEDALRKLLTSDEEDEEENKNEEGNKSDQEEATQNEGTSLPGSAVKKKKKKESFSGKSGSCDGAKNGDTSSDASADSSDSDNEKSKGDTSFDSSQASTCAETSRGSEPVIKKLRLDVSNGESCVSEEAVRRYLTRKPMTATELLQKFKKLKTNLSSEKLVDELALVLKKINPMQQTIQSRLYLSLKPGNTARLKP